MSDYQDNLMCTKIIDSNGNRCGKSPARHIEILDCNLCEEYQKELSQFIYHQLGESYEEEK